MTAQTEKPTEVRTIKPDDLDELLAMPVGGRVEAIVPKSLKECLEMADEIIKAGLVPDGLKGPKDKRVSEDELRSKVAVCIQKGLEVGFKPVTSLSRITVINNRPAIDCAGAMALALHSGKLEWCKEWFEGEGEERKAVCEVKRREVDEPVNRSFSVADAKRAGLWKNHKKQPWIQYPQIMLPTRARAFALNVAFADVLAGLAILEEQRDIEKPPCAPDTSFLDDEPAPEAETEPETEMAIPEPSSEPVETTDPKWEQVPKSEAEEIHPYIQNVMDGLAGCTNKEQVEALYDALKESRATFLEENPGQKDLLLNLFSDREKELP